MRWQQDMQVKLRSRYKRLYTAGGTGLAQEIDLVTSWIAGQPALMYAIDEARLCEKAPDPDEWMTAGAPRGMWEWPTKTEAGRAIFAWDLLQHISASSQPIHQFLFVFSAEKTFDQKARDFSERKLAQPLFDYLDEKIGDGSKRSLRPGEVRQAA